jgi:hypothetical protein
MPSRVAALALITALGGIGPAVRADNGTVVFSSGQATLVEKGGKTARLAKGQQVGPGDLLRTRQGQVQLQFPDGTYASITPGSDLRIDAYRYSTQPGARNTAFFTLYRGGVRFMTGTIAQLPAGRFRLNTPFGTLHAEAAEFSALASEGLQVSVGAGNAQVRNQAGALRLAAGQRGFVPNPSAPPMLVGTIVPAPVTPR